MPELLLIRADADERAATGHVMRCLALAQAWNNGGGTAVLLGRCAAPELRARVESAGVRFIPLERSHPDPSDARITLQELERSAAGSAQRPWLVLDGYPFDEAYHTRARGSGARLLVIDDHAHQPKYRADVLLNQNIHAETLPYAINPDALQLLGTRYALLRPEFAARPEQRRRIAPTARKILVTLGGVDAPNASLTVLRAIQSLDLPKLEAAVVVGAGNPHYDALQAAATGSKVPVRLLRNPSEMPELMAWADVAVGAGGGTAWEMAFLGLPSVVTTLAENQRGVAAGLDRAGAAISLGDAASVAPKTVARALDSLCRDAEARRRMSEKGRALVDGRGAERIVRVLRALDESPIDHAIQVRPARAEDVLSIWRLSNDPSVRANSFNPENISLDEHLRWYKKQLADRGARLWVLTLADTLVGQVRYTRDGSDAAEVHFSVSVAFRGKGLGTLALERTYAQACAALKVSRVRGVVINPNEASARAFLKAGFQRKPDVREKNKECSVFELERSEKAACR